MSKLLNRAKANTATTGTGAVTPGSAVAPYQTWAASGAVSGVYYQYLLEDGLNWEVGTGLYNGTTVTRPGPGVDPTFESSTAALLNLTGSATIACSMLKSYSREFEELEFWDHAVDGATTGVIADVSNCDEVLVAFNGVTCAASTNNGFQVSVDGGATYYNTLGDYRDVPNTGAVTDQRALWGISAAATAARSSIQTLLGLRSGTSPKASISSRQISQFFLASPNPITHVRASRITSGTGAINSMTAGSIRISGR